jgi:hypothetical protein
VSQEYFRVRAPRDIETGIQLLSSPRFRVMPVSAGNAGWDLLSGENSAHVGLDATSICRHLRRGK